MVDIETPVTNSYNTQRKFSKAVRHNKQPILRSSDLEVDTMLHVPGFNESMLDFHGHEPKQSSSPKTSTAIIPAYGMRWLP